jgi:hypothetical protein
MSAVGWLVGRMVEQMKIVDLATQSESIREEADGQIWMRRA